MFYVIHTLLKNIFLSVCPSIRPSVHLSICLSVHLFVTKMFFVASSKVFLNVLVCSSVCLPDFSESADARDLGLMTLFLFNKQSLGWKERVGHKHQTIIILTMTVTRTQTALPRSSMSVIIKRTALCGILKAIFKRILQLRIPHSQILGTKWCLIFGAVSHALFNAAHFCSSHFTLFPAGAMLGLGTGTVYFESSRAHRCGHGLENKPDCKGYENVAVWCVDNLFGKCIITKSSRMHGWEGPTDWHCDTLMFRKSELHWCRFWATVS